MPKYVCSKCGNYSYEDYEGRFHCNWCGSKIAQLASSETYGLEDINEIFTGVFDKLAVGTLEAYKEAHKELGEIVKELDK